MVTPSKSPPSKRIKLEPVSPDATPRISAGEDVIADGDNCSICLQEISDQTVIPTCSHEFCFECLLIWTKQSRRCPLCAQPIGEYVIHNIRSKHDFSKHYLAPLRASPVPQVPTISATELEHRPGFYRRRRLARERERERRERLGEELNEVDRLQRSVAKRRWVYCHGLYAKHVASNAFTRYRPYPSPTQFSASQDLVSRTTSFVRRELQVWPHLDIEFLTTFTVSIMKSIDIRSESAVRLLAEFLDMGAPYADGGRHVNAEHFAHEIYSFVRSPYKDIFVYDDVVQYDVPAEVPPPPNFQSSRRWRRNSPSPSPSPSRSNSHSTTRSRSGSRSPYRSASVSPSTYHAAHVSLRSRSLSRSCTHIPDGSHEHTEVGFFLPGSLQTVRPEPEDGDRNGSADYVIPNTSTEEVRPKNLETLGKQSNPSRPTPINDDREQLTWDGEKNNTVEYNSIISSEGGRYKLDAMARQEIKARLSPSDPPQQRPSVGSTTRPPRNRSLRESVEAHLGNGKRKDPLGAQNSKNINITRRKGGPGAANVTADSFKSIYSSTDQSHTLPGSNASTSTGHNIPNGRGDMISLNVKGSQATSTSQILAHVGVSDSHSVPEVLHAAPRIELTQETVTLTMETAVRDCSPNQGGTIWRGLDHVGTSRPPRNAINTPPDCNDPLNPAQASHDWCYSHDSVLKRGPSLLSRLKAEKDYACNSSKLAVDALGCTTHEHHPPGPTTNDTQVMEDQLRRRARLRMKLAIEKRGISDIISG